MLGYDWAEVDQTVDEMEHAMTEEFANRLERLLDYPAHCPHGDPIPNMDLELPLTTLPVAQWAIISRVTGTPDMLRNLKKKRLTPGTRLILHERAIVGGLLTIERADEKLPLSPLVAGAIFVRSCRSKESAV